MQCLIIGVDNLKRSMFSQRKIEYKWLRLGNFGCDVLILPYSDEEITNMKERKFRKMMSKIENNIRGRVICTYNNIRIENFIFEHGGKRSDGAAVIVDIIDVLVKKCAKNNGIDLEQTVLGICDYNFTEVTYNILLNLAMCCDNISIYTQNVPKAQAYVDKFFYETGMTVLVSNNMNEWIKGKKIICVVGEWISEVESDVVVIDVMKKNNFGIKKVYFELEEKYLELLELVNKQATQDIVEFLLKINTDLDLRKNIKVIGYK